jgi:hypothetical protein
MGDDQKHFWGDDQKHFWPAHLCESLASLFEQMQDSDDEDVALMRRAERLLIQNGRSFKSLGDDLVRINCLRWLDLPEEGHIEKFAAAIRSLDGADDRDISRLLHEIDDQLGGGVDWAWFPDSIIAMSAEGYREQRDWALMSDAAEGTNYVLAAEQRRQQSEQRKRLQ